MTEIKIPWSGWKIVRTLGHGTYGYVYEIERDVFGDKEKAALKVLSIPQGESELEQDYTDGYDREGLTQKYSGQLQSIVQEYQLMSEMKGHSNVVSCEDLAAVPHDDGIGWDIFIRMELLTPLNHYLRGKEFTPQDVVKLGKDICQALVLCEQKNIVHRDIKPDNIMVSSFGDYKLGDFGIARTMDHATNATKAGTERYMAPEVVRREVYGHEVDIYSLGLVMYWLLNNRRMPFLPLDRVPRPMDLEKAQSRRIGGEKLPEPQKGSSQLKQIVLKACAGRRQDRYVSAREMLKDLENLDREKEPEMPQTSEAAEKTSVGSYAWAANVQSQDTSGFRGENSSFKNETAADSATEKSDDSWDDTQATIGKPAYGRKTSPDEYEETRGVDYREKQQEKKQAEKKQEEKKQPGNRQSEKGSGSRKRSYESMFGEVFYVEKDDAGVEKKDTGTKEKKLPYTDGEQIDLPSYVTKEKVATHFGAIMLDIVLTAIFIGLTIWLLPLFILSIPGAIMSIAVIWDLICTVFIPNKALRIEKIKDSQYCLFYKDKKMGTKCWAVAVDGKWTIAGKGGSFAVVDAHPGSKLTLVCFELNSKKPNIMWQGEIKIS